MAFPPPGRGLSAASSLRAHEAQEQRVQSKPHDEALERLIFPPRKLASEEQIVDAVVGVRYGRFNIGGWYVPWWVVLLIGPLWLPILAVVIPVQLIITILETQVARRRALARRQPQP